MPSPTELAEIEKQKRLEANLFSDMKELIPYLEDNAVSDIAVVDSGEIIVSRFGQGRVFTGIILTPIATQRIILAAAAVIGAKIDSAGGFSILEGVIPRYNARITGLLPPRVPRPELSIRRPSSVIRTLEDYVKDGQLTDEQYQIIVEYIKERKNLIISGSTGSGKTTFTNAVIRKMEEFTPDANFYIVEDVPELQCNARMKTMIWTPKEHAHKAVEEALRFFPDRIIFGEVRNGRIMSDLLEAWNTGHPGNVTTIHADNCLSTVQRIKWLLKSVGNEMESLSDVVHLIVHLRKTRDGIRIDEVMPVKKEADDFISMIEKNNLG